MKCPYCNQEHPDNTKFCPETGMKLESLKACSNPECPDFGKYILPFDSRFCPTCGCELAPLAKENSDYHNDNHLLDIETEVKAIIADKLGVDESQITQDANFSLDLGADSLDAVEIIIELENKFDISIPDEDTAKIATVGDAINYVYKTCKQ